MMNAIGYLRISKKDQSMYSLDAQEDLIKNYCLRNNLNITAIFRDDGECSYSFDRPDYIALENFIQQHKGQINFLVVKDHDRFSRNISEALAKISSLEKKFGVKVIAIDEPLNIDTADPSIFLNRAFKYLMANHELLNIRKRTTQGIRNAIASGRVVNNAPFGYINIRDEQGKPMLEIHEQKATIIQKIFENFISGITLQLIAKEARAMGFNHSGHGAIQKVLNNSVYAGLLRLPAYNGEPEKLVRALHKPIISESVFWIAHERLNLQKKYRSIPSSEFPLRGFIKCDCGMHLTASYSKGKSKYYMYYSCPKERNRNYRGEKMHDMIDEVLHELSFTANQVNKLINFAQEDYSKATENEQEIINSKLKKIEELKSKIERIEIKLINDQIESSTYKKWFAKLSSEKGSLELEVSKMTIRKTNLIDKIKQVVPRLSDLKKLYHSIRLKDKFLLLNKVFEGGLLWDGSVLRTPRLHFALMHNYNKLKEKGLLLIEQPEGFFDKLQSCTA
ncbi:MAG TPA: recombinase family protein [Puia sp.]|nr:recombinase family protein [Puia sp.]